MPSSSVDACTGVISKDDEVRQLSVEIAHLKHELKKKTELLEKKKVNWYLYFFARFSFITIIIIIQNEIDKQPVVKGEGPLYARKLNLKANTKMHLWNYVFFSILF